jgi:hypothetical protein
MRLASLVVSALLATSVIAQDAPAPEVCRAKSGDPGALAVAVADRTYHVASEACRAQFLSDPERYAQLYDALAELEAAGETIAPPRAASLVPS